jgi:hypothetical protein
MFFTYVGMGVHVGGDMQFDLVGEILEQPIKIDEDFLNNVICNIRYILHPKDISEEDKSIKIFKIMEKSWFSL